MKKIIIILFSLSISSLFSQEINEKVVNTDISEVTVFIKGAQIVRTKEIELGKGKTTLKFVNLSPFINSKSLQVKVSGDVTVLAVNHQQNFIDKLEKRPALEELESQLDGVRDALNLEKVHLEILKEELAFLQENRNIGGKNQELSVTNLKEASNFYSSKLTSLKLQEIDRNKSLVDLREKEFDINNQIKTMTGEGQYANGEIIVEVESEGFSKSNFVVTYVVGNAGWIPSYDIRAKNVNEPVEIVYKANVKQDTKKDWKNVKLSLSSANPNLSGVAPELKTYFLNYNTSPPSYKRSISQVEGRVLDGNSQALPGVNVLVKGTTIGTTTDFDGYYSITVPQSSGQLEFAYLGFKTEVIQVQNEVHNVVLQEASEALEEVVVIGYGSKNERSLSNKLKGKVAGVDVQDAVDAQIPILQVRNQTTVDFEIEPPYTIMSDNKSYSVDMANYKLPAAYQYFSVPKIEKEAFLVASIKDWEQYNLLEGEANIFFEGTYIGKTLLDVRYAADSLQISLGRDKNVLIDRKKITDFSSKKFIGTRKEENRDWRISVKNNKSENINLLIVDQIPVSTLDEIKVEVLELANGDLQLDNGQVQWKFDLGPSETRNLDLRYSVKYPKNRNLIIE
ncbi:mucoidy inhibitor MuiA family protein [Maribacter sp. 2307ULW6-5]|uniref:mucoidy inhibitor MuiA family protein n=1 Tax=Maribacter sp. 2307ULW6-5 TaxID=3386275 RepID=UPI0039BD8CAA